MYEMMLFVLEAIENIFIAAVAFVVASAIATAVVFVVFVYFQ